MAHINGISEHYMVNLVTELLQNDGYRVRREVPSLGQSADLVATKSRWVTFIEAKLHDWRRALHQCRSHELVADYICIAIGTTRRPDSLMEKAELRGYGVIHYQPKLEYCEWILPPIRNQGVWPPQRRELGKALREIGYES